MKRVRSFIESESNLTLRRRLGEARALSEWNDIVGTGIAARTRPLQVAGRRLFVLCRGASLRQELLFLRREILQRFNEHAGPGRIREIVFLESDANLSSTLLEANREEAKLVAREGAHVVPEEGEESARQAPPEDEEAAPEEDPDGPVYPVFDAVAYRNEMRQIAEGR